MNLVFTLVYLISLFCYQLSYLHFRALSHLTTTTLLSFEWNSIRLGGPTHGIVTKSVHKTLPGGGGGRGWGGLGGGGVRGGGV